MKLIKEGYRFFVEPVKLNCIVKGKLLIAKVIANINMPVQYGFYIEFSDGFEGEFITSTRPGGWWIDSSDGSDYIEAIKDRMQEILLKTAFGGSPANLFQ